MLAGFDWEASSRIMDRPGGGLEGAVLVSSRPAPTGTIAIVEASAAEDPDLASLSESARFRALIS